MVGDRQPAPHPQMVAMLLEGKEQNLATLHDAAERRPESLGVWIPEGLKAVGYASMLERPVDEHVRWLRIVRDVGVARYEMALRPGERVHVNLLGDRVEVLAPDSRAYRDVLTWQRAWSAAAILRDDDALDRLASVPDALFLDADVSCDAADLAHVAFLRATHGPGASAERRAAARAAMDAAAVTGEAAAWAACIYRPLQAVYDGLFDDAADVGPRLEAALASHARYWSGDRAMDALGWVAWRLVAALAGAGRARSIDVASDYLPLGLTRVP